MSKTHEITVFLTKQSQKLHLNYTDLWNLRCDILKSSLSDDYNVKKDVVKK